MIVLYIILAVFCIVALLLLVALIRTIFLKSEKTEYCPSSDNTRIEDYSNKLSRMVQCETVSSRMDDNIEKFRSFHKVLEELFPSVFSCCEKTDIDGNLILKWCGKSKAKPILLMSHMDVVEASGEWKYPYFSGTVAEGRVWGRGSADTKCSLMAFFQAVEELINDGYTPKCDVYLVSSCTEEIGGSGGPSICKWLKENGIKLHLLCDEGGSIICDPIVGVNGHFAAVGLFEKGYGDLKFIARSNGGHSSAPGKNTPIVRLSKFVASVDKKYPFKSRFSPAVIGMFKTLAPYASFPLKFVFCNLWLFKPILKVVMPMISSQAAAMLRTTIAFTMQSGSQGYNVIPQEASVCANMRFIPHQSADESIDIISKRAQKFSIETEVVYKGYPSESVDLDSSQYIVVKSCINKVFPGIGVMPYVVTGATDARFYGDVCDACIRFSPVLYGPEQLAGMHGLNENIEADCLPGAVDFYKEIIKIQK